MWVTAAWAPGMRGGVAGPRPSLDLVIPTTPPPHGLPWGEEKLLARLGPCVPQREPGPGPSPPDGWAEGQEAPPLLPNQTLENPEQPLLPSRRKPCRRQASRPAPPPRAACAAGAGPAPSSSRRAAFLPPSLRPGDISFPLSLPRGFSQAEMGPWETRNQSRESPGRSLHHPPTYTRIRCRRSPEHVPRPAASRPRLGEAPSVSNPRSRCGTRRSEGKWLARGLRARPWWSPGPPAHAPLRP